MQSRAALLIRVAAALCLLVPAVARADAPGLPRVVRLTYVREKGTERCPDQETLRASLGANARRQVLDDAAKAQLVVRIKRDGRMYRLRGELRDEAGVLAWSQDFHPGWNCDGLVDQMGLVVANVLDPIHVKVPAQEAPPVAAPVVAAPPPIVPATPPPAPTPALKPAPLPPPKPVVQQAPPPPKESDETGILMELTGGAALGTAPNVAPRFLYDVGYRYSLATFAVEAGTSVSTRSVVDGVAVASTLIRFAGVACVHWWPRYVFGCPVVAVNAITGATVTSAIPTAGGGLHVGVGGRVGAEVPLWNGIAATGWGEMLGTAQNARIRIGDDDARSWLTPPVTGSVGVGFAFHL